MWVSTNERGLCFCSALLLVKVEQDFLQSHVASASTDRDDKTQEKV